MCTQAKLRRSIYEFCRRFAYRKDLYRKVDGYDRYASALAGCSDTGGGGRLRASKSADRHSKTLYWDTPRRVRFQLLERFSGPAVENFELFTGMGGGDCGIGFKKGELWLVFAHRNSPSGRWSTQVCSRTRLLSYAVQDLATLRAFKKGEQIKPSIYGHVTDWTKRGKGIPPKPLIRFRVALRSRNETRHTVTDQQGNFVFADVPKAVYEIDVAQPGWRSTRLSDSGRSIDLNKNNCSELFVTMEELQGDGVKPSP